MRDIGSYYVEYGEMNPRTSNRVYTIELKGECTVENFMTQWCDNNISEWGEFIVHYGRKKHHIKYDNGKYTLIGDMRDVLHENIMKATGYGSWGHSNFNLYI